jgi:hypothetical protein
LSIPPLENGDRLSQAGFERRYQAMPQVKKAELIEGVTYVAFPLRIKSHGEPHGDLIGWLRSCKVATPGTMLGIKPTVRLDRQLDWFMLQSDEYVMQLPKEQGIFCSRVFPGLWLDCEALLAGNLSKVLSVLQTGLSTTEHQRFVASFG